MKNEVHDHRLDECQFAHHDDHDDENESESDDENQNENESESDDDHADSHDLKQCVRSGSVDCCCDYSIDFFFLGQS